MLPPKEPETIRVAVKKLWEQVQDHVWYEDCVMDVVHNENTKVIKLVEFNEFGCNSRAGSGLFNWIQDFVDLYLGDAVVKVNSGEMYDI